MIVLDEQISQESIRQAFRWYPGRVAFLKDLRPNTLIDDAAVPAILRDARQPTFVTINVDHFWRVVQADGHYCIVCLRLRQQQADEIPGVVRRLIRLHDLAPGHRAWARFCWSPAKRCSTTPPTAPQSSASPGGSSRPGTLDVL